MSDVVYLDVCCLKRPFDDQRSTRVQLEAAAVAALVDRAEIVNPIQLQESFRGGSE